MTFEQIGYFLALAEEGSFVQAARRCGVSQPSITNGIKSLELALGAALFRRTHAGSEITTFGKQMYPFLVRLHQDRLRALDQARVLSSSDQTIAGKQFKRAFNSLSPQAIDLLDEESRRKSQLKLRAR
jgi:DNA-binding transcriptional LysR family regulator